MVVFLDTNVILDAYFERPAHGEAAGKVMNLCAAKRITGCVSTGVLADTVFIAQHIIKSEDHRKIIPFLCRMIGGPMHRYCHPLWQRRKNIYTVSLIF